MENRVHVIITKTLEHHLRNHEPTRSSLFIVRDNIQNKIKHCSDNIELLFYLDDVLKEPIKISVGSAENRLHITIRINGEIQYNWKKTTWKMEVWNIIESIPSFVMAKLTKLINVFSDTGISNFIRIIIERVFGRPWPVYLLIYISYTFFPSYNYGVNGSRVIKSVICWWEIDRHIFPAIDAIELSTETVRTTTIDISGLGIKLKQNKRDKDWKESFSTLYF